MLKDTNPNFYDYGDDQNQFPGVNMITPTTQYNDAINEAIYGSDEFRMYAYKIKRCQRTRSHDWTECPYAHRGEKAQRRDPRKINYCAIACPLFRNGICYRGDTCEFAHGVFEYWLHPARYRTRPCNAGRFCQRKVCFFAHSPQQLRPETKYRCHFEFRPAVRMDGGDHPRAHLHPHPHPHPHPYHYYFQHAMMMGSGSGGAMGVTSSRVAEPMVMMMVKSGNANDDDDKSGYRFDFLRSLSGLKIRDNEDQKVGRYEESDDFDLPHIDWISKLVD